MAARPVTHQLAKTYQPNMVENQCVSMLITQSHAHTDELTAKKIRKYADVTRVLDQYDVPPFRSSPLIFLRIMIKNQYQTTKKMIIRARKNAGKWEVPSSGQ